jgi:hypothetical protein
MLLDGMTHRHMTFEREPSMAAIEAIVFAGAAGFAVIAAATILVIIGVRQEERRWTLTDSTPPTIAALLARRILGTHGHLPPGEQPASHDSEDALPRDN